MKIQLKMKEKNNYKVKSCDFENFHNIAAFLLFSLMMN